MHSKAVRAVPVNVSSDSFVQDLVFGVIGGRIKTPHTYCYHTPSHPSPIIPISFRLLIGEGMVSYSQLEELNTAMCLQKLAATPENMVPLPENIKPYISTSLASCARLAQLVRSLTANQEVPGSIPGLWATFFCHTVHGQGR